MHPTAKNEPRRSLAALLREARTTHILAIRPQLARWGFKDMPRDGVFAISAIRDCDVSARDLVRKMGVSKQAVSQLLDTLVSRGYVERSLDTVDRRRTRLRLTRRGARVASVCRRAVDDIEQQLLQSVGARCVEHTRATLTALIELAADVESATALSMAG
ncbi:MAG: MarR family transcriptional regulator [Steroidobacteraceae bacterium]